MFHVFNSRPVGDTNHKWISFLPACYPHFPSVGESWKNNIFNTLDEAREYCNRWLGDYSLSVSFPLIPGTPYDFNGYGDYVLILELKE